MSQVLMPEDSSSLESVLSHRSEMSDQELEKALESIPSVEVDGSLPSENELAEYQRYSVSVPSTPDRRHSGFQVWGLDPATATVFVIGLGILLDYVTKNRPKDPSNPNGGGPPIIEGGGSGPQELCKHIVDGEECGHPFQSPTTIRQGGSITVVRYCTRDLDPHPTVEHFKQDS